MVLTIPLPLEGKPLIKAGQKVDFDTPLYEEKVMEEMKIYISQKLDVSPKKIFHYIKKVVGDTVELGEVIAEKKSFMGGRRYKSEFTGTLKEINHNDGSILVSVSTSKNNVQKSFFKGEVVKVEGRELHLKVAHAVEYGAKDVSAPFGGQVLFLKSEHALVSEEEIASRVVIAETITSYTQMKMEALGASGFITLHHLSETSDAPRALFKQIKDFEDALRHALPHCFVDREGSRIVFYS